MKFEKIIIGDKIQKKDVEEGYYVTINYMYRDADGYVDRKWGPFYKGEENSLLDFINMLEKTLEAFPHGKGGCEEYKDKVPELKKWLDGYDENLEFECENCTYSCEKCNIPEIRIGFEWEVTPDGYFDEAIILGYNVEYYNKEDDNFYKCKLS